MAATIANAIPQPLKDVFDQAYKFTKGYVKTAHTMFKNYENRAVVALKVNLHPSTHSAAEKIARSVPETLATLSMLTSFSPLRFLAGAFLAAKAIYTVSPAVKSAFKGDVNGDDWEAAKTETKKRADAVIDKFAPAVCTAFAVAGVAIGALGLLTLRPSLVTTASLFGVISAVGYKAMTPPPAPIAPAVVAPLQPNAYAQGTAAFPAHFTAPTATGQ